MLSYVSSDSLACLRRRRPSATKSSRAQNVVGEFSEYAQQFIYTDFDLTRLKLRCDRVFLCFL